jgi:WD40 repeat protein
MITGSWRTKQQLQLWDVGTGKVIRSATIADANGENPLEIYSLSISRDEQHVAVGGSGRNCVMFFGTKALEEQAATEAYDSCVNSVHIGVARYAYGLMNSQIYVTAGLPWLTRRARQSSCAASRKQCGATDCPSPTPQ